MFRQDFTCPALLESSLSHYPYGAVTHDARHSRRFRFDLKKALAWSAFARHY